MSPKTKTLCHTFLSRDLWSGSVHTTLIKHVGYDAGNVLMFLIECSRKNGADDMITCPVWLLEKHTFLNPHRQRTAIKLLSENHLIRVEYRGRKKERYIEIMYTAVILMIIPGEVLTHSPDITFDAFVRTNNTNGHDGILSICADLSGVSSAQLTDCLKKYNTTHKQLFFAVFHGKMNGIRHPIQWFEKSSVFDDTGTFTQGQYPDDFKLVKWFLTISDDDKAVVEREHKFSDSLVHHTKYLFNLKGIWDHAVKKAKITKTTGR